MLIIYNMLCQYRTFLENFMLHVQPGGEVEPLQIIFGEYIHVTSPVAVISNTTSCCIARSAWLPIGFLPLPSRLWASCSLRRFTTWREFLKRACGDQCGMTIPSRGTDAFPTWGKGKSSSKVPFYGNMIPR